MTEAESLEMFRVLADTLRETPDDRVTAMIKLVPRLHRELTAENYGESLDEAIVLMAAHRIAYEDLFGFGSQVAIADGKISQKSSGDWLLETPYGQRVRDLRIESFNWGAIAAGGFE